MLLDLLHWILARPASQVVLVVKNLPANTGDLRDVGSVPGLGRSPGERNGNPRQYSCLENPMGRGPWQATVHEVTKELDTTDWLNSNNNELSRVSLQGSLHKSHHSHPASPVTGHCPADWSQRSPLFQIQQEESMKNAVSYLQAARPAKTLQRLSLHLVISDLQGLREGNCLGLQV